MKNPRDWRPKLYHWKWLRKWHFLHLKVNSHVGLPSVQMLEPNLGEPAFCLRMCDPKKLLAAKNLVERVVFVLSQFHPKKMFWTASVAVYSCWKRLPFRYINSDPDPPLTAPSTIAICLFVTLDEEVLTGNPGSKATRGKHQLGNDPNKPTRDTHINRCTCDILYLHVLKDKCSCMYCCHPPQRMEGSTLYINPCPKSVASCSSRNWQC